MYTITFIDNTIFHGGSIERSNWNNMPNKAIKKVEYFLLNHHVILENFESYNHLVEHRTLLNNNDTIIKTLLIGKTNDKVYMIIFDIIKKDVYLNIVDFGTEYFGKSTTGWKVGLNNQSISYKITPLLYNSD
jgi:hypothetical protein